MAIHKQCGNCRHFLRVKKWGGSRNGMCNKLDYNCHSDSSYARFCKHYTAKKYNRKPNTFITNAASDSTSKSGDGAAFGA